jgi:hypothetical protein
LTLKETTLKETTLKEITLLTPAPTPTLTLQALTISKKN